MPWRKILKDFNKKTGYEIEYKLLNNYITGIVKNERGYKVGDGLIKDYIMSNLPKQAKEYEAKRQQAILKSQANPNNRKLANMVANMPDEHGFIEGYLDVAYVMVQVAERERKNYDMQRGNEHVEYRSLPYLSFTGEELKTLKMNQLDSFTYRDVRAHKLFELSGIRNPQHVTQAQEAGNYTYSTATDEQKTALQEVYITRNLAKAYLESKNFLWKLFFRKDVKAINAYIEAADNSLRTSGFNETEGAAADAEAMANQGHISQETRNQKIALYDEKGRKVDERVNTERNKRLEEERQKEIEEQRKRDEEAHKKQQEEERKLKEAESKLTDEERQAKIKAENDAKALQEKINATQPAADLVNNKPLMDRFFDANYRPPFTKEGYDEHYKAFAEARKLIVKDIKMPDGVKAVMKLTSEKFKAAAKFVGNESMLAEEYKDTAKFNSLKDIYLLEEKFKTLFPNYKPITYAEAKENFDLQKSLQNDIGNKQNEVDQNPKINEPQEKKLDIVKD